MCNMDGHRALVFVDVDGVLNVACRTPKGSVPLNAGNVDLAMDMRRVGRVNSTAERIAAISEHSLDHGEEGTFSKYTTEESAQDVCEHFLVRLVQLIAAGGKTRRVVLSSTWRRPQHKKRRQVLEHRISTHLGEPFVFDDRTDLVPEQSAADRICTVGDYIANYSKCQNSRSRNSLTVSALRTMFPSPPMSDGDRGLPGRISIH